MRQILTFLIVVLAGCASAPRMVEAPKVSPLVLMTDFSLRDGAVSAMKGVAYQVDSRLTISDLTHEIPPYNIWQGAYRLSQTYRYWPAGTVFVCVVDPGVGSQRRSIAARTNSGRVFVGPDNGLLTLMAEQDGIAEVYAIDENKQRLKGSDDSYTFHGRDLYVYVGARLATGQLRLVDVGAPLSPPAIRLNYQKPEFKNGEIRGIVPILDVNYGNVWTNIPKALVQHGFAGRDKLRLQIFSGSKKIYDSRLPVATTFAAVPKSQPLLYYNSLMNLSVALNEDDFSKRFKIESGPEWTVVVSP